MDEPREAFLRRLIDAPSPSGFETAGQRVWVDDVAAFAVDAADHESFAVDI